MDFMLPASVEVDELFLRRPAEADRTEVVELLSADDGIARWTTVPFPYTGSDFDSFLGKARDDYLIERASEIVGAVGATVTAEARTATFGYWLGGQFRGHGIVTRSGRWVCSELFDAGIERIVAQVIVGNLASGAVLDRLGFTLEGVERSVYQPSCGLTDARIDQQVWSLLPGELQ